MSSLKQLVWPLLLIVFSGVSLGVYYFFRAPVRSLERYESDFAFRCGVLVLILIGIIWSVCIVHPKRKDAFTTKR